MSVERTKDGVPIPLRVVIFGEGSCGKSTLLRRIEAMLEADGVRWVPGVDSDDVESIHVAAVTP